LSQIAAQSQAHSVQPTAVVEFTGFRFNDLPPELRSKIWKSALPGSRVVKYNRLTRRPVATPILLVCRESREEALRHYKPLITGTGSITYIDPKIDILWINDFRFFADKLERGIDPAILAAIHHIAYPFKKLEDLIHWPNYIIRERDPIHPRAFTMHAARHFIEHIFDFTALKTLTLVDTVLRKDESKTRLQDFFTTPISHWPIRQNHEPFSQEDRLRLCLELYWTWGGELRWPEEVQKAWYDTMASMREMVDAVSNRQAFEVEIKGLIEPAGRVWLEDLFNMKLDPR
jgi:hypothetical protein